MSQSSFELPNLEAPSSLVKVRICTRSYELIGNIHLTIQIKESRALSAYFKKNEGFIALTDVTYTRFTDGGAAHQGTAPFIQLHLAAVEWVEPL